MVMNPLQRMNRSGSFLLWRLALWPVIFCSSPNDLKPSLEKAQKWQEALLLQQQQQEQSEEASQVLSDHR